MIFMVQVNRVYLIIIFFNRPHFLVDSNDFLLTYALAVGEALAHDLIHHYSASY